MVEKLISPARNVVDLARYQRERNGAAATLSISARMCRHCGAALSEGEREDECSGAFDVEARLRWQAAQILRGLMSARVIADRRRPQLHARLSNP